MRGRSIPDVFCEPRFCEQLDARKGHFAKNKKIFAKVIARAKKIIFEKYFIFAKKSFLNIFEKSDRFCAFCSFFAKSAEKAQNTLPAP